MSRHSVLRDARGVVLLAGLAFITAGLLVAASPVSAAQPHGGSRYLGFAGSWTSPTGISASVDVRVSASGRRFTRGSIIQIGFGCAPTQTISLAGTRIHDGRFAMNERQRHFRLRGHFVTRRIARYRYSAPSPARGPDALPQCKRKVHAGVLYEHGEPPFAGCRSHAAQTDVENDEGRIFEQVRYEPRFRGFRQFTFACLFSNPNTRVRLGLSSVSYPGFTGPRLAAPYAAFIATDCGGCSYDNPSVQVRDLRDGRIVSDLRWRMTTLPLTQEVRIADLELKPDGSVAWLAQFRYYDSARGGAANIVELTAVDANGRRLLDSSDAVVPDSLTLDGSTLTWVNAGVTHSATLD